MNKADLLMDAIGEVQDEFVNDVYKRSSFVKAMRPLIKTAIAAVLVFAIISSVNVLKRLDYFSFGNRAEPVITGTAVDGALYYEVPHKGIYKYTPDKGSEQILWKYWYEEYTVNSYAVYYTRGDTVYSIPHRTGESKELFTAKGADEISVYPCGQDIIISFYIKDNYRNLLIDGKTGENLGTIMGFDMDPDTLKTKDIPQDAEYSLGDRKLSVTEENGDYIIKEKGKAILKKNESLSFPIPADYYIYLEGCLVFELYDKSLSDDSHREYLILRQSGKDSRITVNPEEGEGISCGDENYLFDQRFDNNIVCIDAYTGKTWDIAKDKRFEFTEVVAADTDYLYISEYSDYDEPLSCWKIVFDSDNKPASLELVNNNIL